MPRICTVCAHPERAAIDAALVAGESYRGIAKRFELSDSAVFRHKTDHIPAALAQAQQAAEVAHGDGLLDQVRALQAKTLAILKQAEQGGELRTALAAIREARGNLELLARLLGELRDQPTVNLLLMPEWVTVRTTLLTALEDFPEARAAAAAALLKLDDHGR